jgi:hypothetical protein
MTIYSKNSKPYVYKCTEKETGRFYIGYRYSNKVPAMEDFGVHYFTSNEYVKNNFDKFEHEIISEFSDRKSAFAYETKLINETKCELQINANKHNKAKKPYGKAQIYENCFLCGKYINSSISKFCCRSHAAKFNATNKNNKLKQNVIVQKPVMKVEKPVVSVGKTPIVEKVQKPVVNKIKQDETTKERDIVNLPKNYKISRIGGTKDSFMWSLEGFDI